MNIFWFSATNLKTNNNAEENRIDSYDKLMAWLFELSTHEDNCDAANSFKIDPPRRCAVEKRAIWREHSVSCDSYTSAETCHLSRPGKPEDLQDIQFRLSVPLSSRQTTFSDDDDGGYNDEKCSMLTVPIANRQTTLSDEEEAYCGLYDEINHLVVPLTDRRNAADYNNVQINREDLDTDATSKQTCLLPPGSQNLKHFGSREALNRRRTNFRMSGKNPIFSASVGQLPDKITSLASGLAMKSASLAVVRQPTFEREFKEMSDTTNQESKNYGKVLDERLLDRNIQDILLSVDVLFNDK